jgi:hypothetical protein
MWLHLHKLLYSVSNYDEIDAGSKIFYIHPIEVSHRMTFQERCEIEIKGKCKMRTYFLSESKIGMDILKCPASARCRTSAKV